MPTVIGTPTGLLKPRPSGFPDSEAQYGDAGQPSKATPGALNAPTAPTLSQRHRVENGESQAESGRSNGPNSLTLGPTVDKPEVGLEPTASALQEQCSTS